MVEGGSLVGNESARVLSSIFSRTCSWFVLSTVRSSGSRRLPRCSLDVLGDRSFIFVSPHKPNKIASYAMPARNVRLSLGKTSDRFRNDIHPKDAEA